MPDLQSAEDVSDAERMVAKELRARGRYVSGDAGAVIRALADPTPAMIEVGAALVYDAASLRVEDVWRAMLRAETREEQP